MDDVAKKGIDIKFYKVAVVLVNYNSSDLTIACIRSLVEQTDPYLNYQIIVIDNNSEASDYDNLFTFIHYESSEDWTLVRSPINLGFGGGNMLAMPYVRAEYLAFINNDTLMSVDCLSLLLNALSVHSDIAIVGGQAYDTLGISQPSFGHFTTVCNKVFGRRLHEWINPSRYPRMHAHYTHPLRVDYVIGSMMLLKTSDFAIVGGFDTNIFLYLEETDLCKRLKKVCNKGAMLIPSARYIHLGGGSTQQSLDIIKESRISLMYVIRKHSGYLPYLFLKFYTIMRYIPKALFSSKARMILGLYLRGVPLSESLRQKQIIHF